MKPWTRDDTKEWIVQLENRIEDIDYYLNQTLKWCEDNEIYSDKIVFICSVMTVIWVSTCRNEPVGKKEVFEILGIENWQSVEDDILKFNPTFESMELEDLLHLIVRSF
jgi:hypothetical protein